MPAKRTLEEIFRDFTEKDLMDIIMHTASTVWKNDVEEGDIGQWLSNYTGEVYETKYERLIALWLLSHFTYYNESEVRHLCRVVYNDLIHRIVTRTAASASDPENLVEDFFNSTNIITWDKTGGSDGFIAYMFRQANKLPMTLFNFSIDKVKETFNNIIVIDDVTLSTGQRSQMYRYFDKNIPKNNDQSIPKDKRKNFYLLTLVSSNESIEYLESKFGVEVVAAIKLDPRDKCFNSKSDVFSDCPDLLAYGRRVAEHYGERFVRLDVGPLGYNNGQHTFGFFYNTPDNTLPIFWGQIDGWIPIMKRFHKNYSDRRYLRDERFI